MRKLNKIDVSFISLVDKGANRKKLIFKSISDGASVIIKTLQITKCDEDQRMVFCIVYSPDEVDAQGDVATADVIKDAAYNFMRYARTNNVDKQHDFIPDEGFVAESWIIKENDPIFPDEPAGSWAVGIKVENEETWQLVKNGELTGISLAGLALIDEMPKQNDTLIEKIKELLHLKSECGLDDHNGVVITTDDCKTSKAIVNENANEEILNSLNGKIFRLEKTSEEINTRLEQLENRTEGSRQLRKEEEIIQNKITIWT